MIVSITGGGGFIGRLLVERHVQRGDQIRLLTRKVGLLQKGVEYFMGDLSTPDSDFTDFVNGTVRGLKLRTRNR